MNKAINLFVTGLILLTLVAAPVAVAGFTYAEYQKHGLEMALLFLAMPGTMMLLPWLFLIGLIFGRR